MRDNKNGKRVLTGIKSMLGGSMSLGNVGGNSNKTTGSKKQKKDFFKVQRRSTRAPRL